MSKDLQAIEALIQTPLKDPDLMRQAFMHRSYVNERPGAKLESNERLEYLGDAVLEVIVSDYLYHEYPHKSEGQLSRLRAQLVCEASLATLARHMHLDDLVQVGGSERSDQGKKRESIIADAYEAFLGALYLQFGLDFVRAFLEEHFLANHRTYAQSVDADFKSQFQERVQQRGQVQIAYRVTAQEGPPHQATFTSTLYLEGQALASGQGSSKKRAEMQAAERGLAKLDDQGFVKED